MIVVLFGVKGSGKDTVGDLLVNYHRFTKDSFAAPLKAMAKLAFPDFTDDSLYGSSDKREEQFDRYPFSLGTCLSCGMDPDTADHEREGYWTSTDHTGRADAAGKFVQCSYCGLIYPKFVNPRIALQTLGTEWGRRLFRDIWVSAALRRAQTAIEDSKPSWTERMVGERSKTLAGCVITDGRFHNEQRYSSAHGAKTVLLLRKRDLPPDTTHPSEMEVREMVPTRFDYVLDNTGPLEDLPGLVKTMLKSLRSSL